MIVNATMDLDKVRGARDSSEADGALSNGYDGSRYHMATLDWSQCPAVESVPGEVSGAWVFKGTRMPVRTVFENLEAGMPVDEITEVFDVTPEEVKAVLHFASESLANEPTCADKSSVR